LAGFLTVKQKSPMAVIYREHTAKQKSHIFHIFCIQQAAYIPGHAGGYNLEGEQKSEE
jgi:hypothetical protein